MRINAWSSIWCTYWFIGGGSSPQFISRQYVFPFALLSVAYGHRQIAARPCATGSYVQIRGSLATKQEELD